MSGAPCTPPRRAWWREGGGEAGRSCPATKKEQGLPMVGGCLGHRVGRTLTGTVTCQGCHRRSSAPSPCAHTVTGCPPPTSPPAQPVNKPASLNFPGMERKKSYLRDSMDVLQLFFCFNFSQLLLSPFHAKAHFVPPPFLPAP